jgi:uncharacterized protein (TIGR02246 family)
MRCYRLIVGIGAIVAIAQAGWAKQEPQTERAGTIASNSDNSPEVTAIKKGEEAFKAAFEAGDAKAVAALWTPDGELVEESGARIEGRAAIEKRYAEFFKANPKVRIAIRIDIIRFPNANTALEDGSATVSYPSGIAMNSGNYSVVHVKRDGKWLMWSVHETPAEESAQQPSLDKLGWMIGDWTAENKGVEFHLSCRWMAGKHFIEQNYSARRGNKLITSGRQIVGWDPARQKIASWMFTSDGGHAYGVWTPREDGMVVEAEGVLPDGTPTRAVNITKKLDAKAIMWRSTERSAGGAPLAYTDEVILKRVKNDDAKK